MISTDPRHNSTGSPPSPGAQCSARLSDAECSALLQWAVERWNAEVRNRPLVNVNRRPLDDTWRQVIRYAGGNDRELIGPTHDELLLAPNARTEPRREADESKT